MSVQYLKPDPVLLGLDVDNELSCPVCTNTYYNPVTLLCQHTFCYHCISDKKIQNCPICRVKKFIPKTKDKILTDNIMNNVLELYYGTEQMNKLKEEVEDYQEEIEMQPKIHKDMEAKLLANLNKLANPTSKKNIINSNINNNTYTILGENYHPIPIQPSPYDKYLKWIKYGIIWLLAMGIGWIAGNMIVQIIDIFKGRASIIQLIYTFVRLCGSCNMLYQLMCNMYI